MKPSERIYQLMGKTFSDSQWQKQAIISIMKYLDEKVDSISNRIPIEAYAENFKLYINGKEVIFKEDAPKYCEGTINECLTGIKVKLKDSHV